MGAGYTLLLLRIKEKGNIIKGKQVGLNGFLGLSLRGD